jgi:DnaJ-domain-containing protein 1
VTLLCAIAGLLLAEQLPATATAAITLEATTQNFLTEVAQGEVVSLIQFTSTKCEATKDSPCVQFAPEWTKLAEGLKRMKVYRADIDTEDGKQLAKNLNVFNEGFPNLKLFNFKTPPAELLMAGTLQTAKQIRIKLKSALFGFKKNDDGFFLKGKRPDANNDSGGGGAAAAIDEPIDQLHYEALELSDTATPKQIRKAFRKLSVKYHPDKSGDKSAKAKTRFRAITEANRVLSDPDLRKLYHAYGRNFAEPAEWQVRRNKYAARHKDIIFFEDTDGVRNFGTKDGDELDGGLKQNTVLFVYSPWHHQSQKAMLAWKQMPDMLRGDDIQIGAISCDASTLCKEFSIQQVPSIQIWALNEKTVDTYPDNGGNDDYAAEKVAHWLRANIVGRSLMDMTINKQNFEQKVLASPDPWMVVLCGDPRRYPICGHTKKTFNRLAYILHKTAGIKMAYVTCTEERKEDGFWLDEWCEVDMGVQSMGDGMPWSFPFIKLYKRGTEKGGGESVDLNVKQPKFMGDKLVPDQVLNIIELVTQFAAPDPSAVVKEEVEDFPDDEDDDKEEPESKEEL